MRAATPGSPATSAARSRPATWGLAAALGIAFLVLRAWGLDFGSPPIQTHPDERHYAAVAEDLGWEDLNPHYFENPPLLTYALFASKALYGALVGPGECARWVEAGGLYRLGRWISAGLGAATALLVGLAAATLLGGSTAGFLAAAVAGFSFLHGRDSHYGVNDVPMVFWVSACLLLSARWLRGGRDRLLCCAAVTAGLAAATKYNGAVAVALPVAALWLHRDTGQDARQVARQVARRLLLSAGLVAVSLAIFVAANPYSVLAFDEFDAGFRHQLTGWGEKEMWGVSRSSNLVRYGQATLALLGWAHAAAAVAGLILLARRAPRVALFLLACPVLYLAGMFSKQLFFWRFALPLLPFLAIFAAGAWDALAARALSLVRPLAHRPAAARAVAAAVLLLLASAQPALALARHDLLASRPTTWMQARQWLRETLPPGAQVLIEGFPLNIPTERFREWLPQQQVENLALLADSSQAGETYDSLEQGGWLVTDSFYEEGWKHELRGPVWADLYAKIRRSLDCVAEFAPGPAGDPQPFVIDSVYSPLVDLWTVERHGYTIRVYRLESGQLRRIVKQ